MIHCPKFQLGYADLPPAFFSEKFDIANGSYAIPLDRQSLFFVYLTTRRSQDGSVKLKLEQKFDESEKKNV